MKNILIPLLFLVLSTSPILAQEEGRKHNLYGEFLGAGSSISANYEIFLKKGVNNGWAIRMGTGYINFAGGTESGGTADVTLYSFPLTASYLFGKNKSLLETGVSVTPSFIFIEDQQTIEDALFEEEGFTTLGFIHLGYRFQALNNGLVFRINWSPAITNTGFHPLWFGLSLGYSFRN